jgi:hypothetical protein
VLPTAAAAQQSTVSPVGTATVEGSSGNVLPFASDMPRRYLQIHEDLMGTPRVLTGLSFRMNEGINAFNGTRAIDLELHMGYARPISQLSFFIDQNRVGPYQTVIARRVIHFGPQGQAIRPGPNPFSSNMDLILDVPFPYSGVQPLIWEAVVHANALVIGTTFSSLDADEGSSTLGASTRTGLGCTCTGQFDLSYHFASATDMAGILLINFSLDQGPANSPALVSIGSSNPNLSVPGLCSPLYTNLIAIIPIGVVSSQGYITDDDSGAASFVMPNTLAGATLYTQVHALDLLRPDPIQVCNSSGRSTVVPTSNLTKVVRVARLLNYYTGVTGTQATFFNTTSVGYGLVTRFTH